MQWVRFSSEPGNLLWSCRRATRRPCPRAEPRQSCSSWHWTASPPCPAKRRGHKFNILGSHDRGCWEDSLEALLQNLGWFKASSSSSWRFVAYTPKQREENEQVMKPFSFVANHVKKKTNNQPKKKKHTPSVTPKHLPYHTHKPPCNQTLVPKAHTRVFQIKQKIKNGATLLPPPAGLQIPKGPRTCVDQNFLLRHPEKSVFIFSLD